MGSCKKSADDDQSKFSGRHNKTMNYLVGVLRHEENGHAEEQLIAAGKSKNLEIVMIDPFSVTIGITPEFIRHRGKPLKCDGIISRCEINSFLSPEYEAYLRLLHYYESRKHTCNQFVAIDR